MHLCNPVQLTHGALAAHLRGLGYALEELCAEEYQARVLGPPASPRHAEAQQLLLAQAEEPRARPRLACEATTALLAGSGVACPAPSQALLERLVRHAVERGYFPAPAR